MSKSIIIIGGEGNGGVIVSAIVDMVNNYGYDYTFEGYLNDFEEIGTELHGYPVLGKTTEIERFAKEGAFFVWAIHMIGHGERRRKLYYDLNIPEERLISIVHPKAFVAFNVEIGPGAFIMANSYVGPGTKVGKGTLIMANCIVGHNTVIGELCHLSAGCTVGSYVKIGNASDIALGAIVLEKRTIGDYSVLGANSLLTKDIGNREIFVGSPAKLHRKIEEYE